MTLWSVDDIHRTATLPFRFGRTADSPPVTAVRSTYVVTGCSPPGPRSTYRAGVPRSDPFALRHVGHPSVRRTPLPTLPPRRTPWTSGTRRTIRRTYPRTCPRGRG